MDIYPSNSYKSRETREYGKEPSAKPVERKKLKQVATAKRRGDTAVSKALHLDNDVAEGLWSYLLNGLIGPTFKDTMYKIVTNVAHAIIFQSLSFDNKSSSSSSGYRSYRSFSDEKPRASRSVENDYGTLSKYPTCDVLFRDRLALEEVISQLEDTLEETGVVSIGDLYDSVGWDTYPTYYSYGWKDLSNVKIDTTIGGYVLHMPKPMQIS